MKRISEPVVLLLLCTGLASATVVYTSGVDVGVATNVGTNTSTDFNAFTATLAGFTAANVDDLQSVTPGTTNGSLGTADGVTITAGCVNCDATFSGILADNGTGTPVFDTQNGYSTSNGIPQTSGAATGTLYYGVAGSISGTTSQNSALTLSFSGLGVTAFGLEVTDIQTYYGTTTVTFNDGSPESFVLANSGSATGCPAACPAAGDQFFGFATTGTPVTSITFTTVQAHPTTNLQRDIFGIDELVIGSQSATPEPATFGLMGAALVGLGAYGYRRRRV